MWSIDMTDKATTPTSLRLPDGLIRQLTKAAHKREVSRTQYVVTALQAAVRHDLPTPEYQQAWNSLQFIYNSLMPESFPDGSINDDMRLASALEAVLPRLRCVV
jgi:hypothetical protein